MTHYEATMCPKGVVTYYADTSDAVKQVLILIKTYLGFLDDEEQEVCEYVLNQVEENLASMDLISVLGPKADEELEEAWSAEHRYSSDFGNTPYCDKHVLNSDWLHLMDELADALNCSLAGYLDAYYDEYRDVREHVVSVLMSTVNYIQFVGDQWCQDRSSLWLTLAPMCVAKTYMVELRPHRDRD